MNARWILLPLLIAGPFLSACAAPAPSPDVALQQASSSAAEPAAPPKSASAGASAEPAKQGAAVSASNSPSARSMVIKDAQIDLLVENPDQALAQVLQMAADYGGYVISSQTWYTDQHKFATVRLGVLAANFENALNTLRHTGMKVLQETASGNDVSSEYVDLQSKLANLEATSARVRSFLDNASTVEESLRINQTLTELEGQIEQVKGQMKYYEGRSAFSTITVNLNPFIPTPPPVPTPTPTPVPAWNPGSTFEDASNVLAMMFHGTVDLLIWVFVAIGPYALVFGVLYWFFRQIFIRKGNRTTNQG